MRILSKLVAGAAVAAAAIAMAAPAVADPASTPSLTTLAGTGSDTVTPLFDNGVPGGASGSFVHDYNATRPLFHVASWDAVNPRTGAAGDTITTKALKSSDKSCQLPRPNGSGAGIKALNLGQTDTNKVGGQKIFCIDYARSSRPPNTTTFDDAFVALAKDALAWSFPTLRGKTNPQPKSLTKAQLIGIYTCKLTNWNQVGGKNAPIGVVIPQTGSGSRATWLLQLGITVTDEPCWQNGTVVIHGVTTVIEENTGLSAGNIAQFTKPQKFPDGKTIAAQDDIFPYSIGDWIAQDKLTHGVGGHATPIWGHGNMVQGRTSNEVAVRVNAKGQPVINPLFPSAFVRILFGVVRNGCIGTSSSSACLPKTPTYEAVGLKAFFGPKGWICTNRTAAADIVSYGFTRISNCGSLTAGD
jgi:ABC-type phosphate transport system substrate-binding protein